MNKNPFLTAAVAAEPKKGNGKKNLKPVVTIEGLRSVAALDAVEKAVKSLKDNLRASVDGQILDHFVAEGAALHRQPENFRGIEFDASASCELRKRSNRSALNEVEIKILSENAIPVEEIADKAETFIINPRYLEDSKLIERVGKAIGKVPGLPTDFLQKQEATVRTVASDDSLRAVFEGSSDKIAELLRIVGVIALKPKLEQTDLADALDLVKDLVAEEKENLTDAFALSVQALSKK